MCKHPRTISVSGKSADLNYVRYSGGGGEPVEGNGYVPSFLGSWGDYIEFTLCCDCGHVILENEYPLSDDMIREDIANM